MTIMRSLSTERTPTTAVARTRQQQQFCLPSVAKNQNKQQQCACKNVRHNNNNNSTESPISIYAPPPTACSNQKFLLILFLSAAVFLLTGNGLPTVTAAINGRTEPGECRSIDVRNDCDSLKQLHNCTIIRGFLWIVLTSPVHYKTKELCNYENYTFPLLREITDYLIFHEVRGLRSIRNLFPNLAVIRGRRLFLNYALGITAMPDLEVLEFPSLLAIQRGHIYLNNCPKLCNLDKIDFDRLTLSVGENHIYPMASDDCQKTVCQNCVTEHCWSNNVCQRFENDNLIDAGKGIQHCHSECLGGCHNSSSDGCYTCKNRRDHGNCVKECPPDKYLLELDQTCHSAAECVTLFNMTVKDNKCLLDCPEGSVFGINGREAKDCIPCDMDKRDIYPIYNLADADRLRGCKILNGSIIITIRNKINEDDLVHSLSNLREIHGHLKIIGSDGLTSLKFLNGLQKIAVNPEALETGLYGLVLYDNENLRDLWQPEKNLEIVHGSMYVHLNKKLCNRKLREFTRKVRHDVLKDALQTNDQEVLCDPAKLTLDIEILSQRSAKFSWPKEQTSSEVEIMYRPIAANAEFVEHSELDTPICKRLQWTRVLTFPKELQSNATHYSYIANDLKPKTRYACLVKTFGFADIHDTRSDLTYITTKVELPAPPTINITRRTDTSLTIQLQHAEDEVVSQYVLDIYDQPDNEVLLDHRDFCTQPSYMYHDKQIINGDEDEDACCLRKEEEADDQRFLHNMRELFACNSDQLENCAPDTSVADAPPGTVTPLRAMLRMYLDAASGNATTISKLKRFRLYTLQVQSCNEAGCGAYAFQSTRTNFSIGGDRLESLMGCRVSGLNEFHVYFPEPQQPNAVITSYVVHFRQKQPDSDTYKTHIECVTRSQHSYNNFQLIAQLDTPYNEVAVRVYSLAGGFFTTWMPITICPFNSAVVKMGAVTEHPKGYAGKVFMVCFMFGVGTFIAWACVKWGWWRWRRIEQFRRDLSRVWNAQTRRRDDADQSLVEYRNIPEEERLENSG
ncbi:insulin receptor [Zeugodacus cucurbitae]|uniref:insulin receptor n=1 Tax=Zeugodacus cucurbitae TaxID=28588 RepID=UPI00059698AB|nr:insulin receptor [Zeugodacus cucurbitae]